MRHTNLRHPEERPGGVRLEGRSNLEPAIARDAGEGPAGGQKTLLIYRHRLAPLSEVEFLRRFYVGFERLAPVWLGCHIDAGAGVLTKDPLRLGRGGPLGALDRTLFRHFGLLPPRPDLRALRPLLLHAHFGPGGALALPIARSLAIPLVVTFHGADATKETHYRQRLVPRIPPPVLHRALQLFARRRLTAWVFKHYLRIAPPESSRPRFHALKPRGPFHSSASPGNAALNLQPIS